MRPSSRSSTNSKFTSTFLTSSAKERPCSSNVEEELLLLEQDLGSASETFFAIFGANVVDISFPYAWWRRRMRKCNSSHRYLHPFDGAWNRASGAYEALYATYEQFQHTTLRSCRQMLRCKTTEQKFCNYKVFHAALAANFLFRKVSMKSSSSSSQTFKPLCIDT